VIRRTQFVCLLFLYAASVGQCTQAQDTGQAHSRVRRLSAGVTLGVPVQPAVRSENLTQSFPTTPPLAIESTNTPKGLSTGYGIAAQVAFARRFAFAVNPLIRKVRYTAFTVRYVGTDNPNTPQDERQGTNINEDTEARLLDIPMMIRFYGRDREEEGHRWFAGIGPVLRYASKVRTHLTITPPNQVISEDTTPVSYRKRSLGAVAGFGGQFVDPLGIRVMPEVRYTRWLDTTFGGVSGRSRRQQIEILISLTF